MRTTKFDLWGINFATACSNDSQKSIIKIARELTRDPDKESRVSEQLCKWCYYHGRRLLTGQAFTSYKCISCSQDHSHPNTGVPSLCMTCAAAYKLCKQCCAAMNGRERKKIGNEIKLPSTRKKVKKKFSASS